MPKKILAVTLGILMIFSLVACSQQNKDIDNNKDVNVKEKDVILYFADDKLTSLVAEKVKVQIDEKPLEEIILDRLKQGPKSEKLKRTIAPHIQILGVEVVNNTARVNISSSGLHGGSTEEVFFIASIVKSLTELDYINKVQFLVDGKKVESLMGIFM
ncbi:GerMN domain-containing protein [Caloranaerobacter azorensis]|uniref:GerMN domain-containing protein n=1 Tax=Caloranaerobacter azorensis TaxID=116090 RepID=A0A6P1YAC4_9FIRM|nr:GerMN domain-containing protein [Caloranaerobacter azorensis]QIB25977.1 GerMN domain-containing protein [Caloranaerobacter azorensis]